MAASWAPGPSLELVEPGAQVGDQPLGGRVAQRRGGVTLARQAGGAALVGQQVDRQRRVPVGGQARRDRADVRGESAVLVDHEHGARGRRGRREHPEQLTVRSGEADLLTGRPAPTVLDGPSRPCRGRDRCVRRSAPSPRRRLAARIVGARPAVPSVDVVVAPARRRAAAAAASLLRPSRPRRRNASRRLSSPPTSRGATSSTM